MLKSLSSLFFLISSSQAQSCDTALEEDTNIPAQYFAYSPYSKNIGEGWSSFFKVTDTNCPVTSCVLKEGPACTKDLVSDKISIGNKAPWQVTASRSSTKKYTEKFCVVCSNGKQTIASKEITVGQSANCAATLVAKKVVLDVLKEPLMYTSDSSSKKEEKKDPNKADKKEEKKDSTLQEIGGWESFFTNEQNDCPIIGCILKQGLKCQNSYKGTDITISAQFPWKINANKNNADGYTENVCMECTNSGEQVTSSNVINITQTADCKNTLSEKKDQSIQTINIGYGTSKLWESKKSVKSFFKNKNSAKCPINKCSLEASCDAPGPYKGGKVTLNKEMYMEFKNDENSGYTDEKLCLVCENSNEAQPTIVKSKLELHQVAKDETKEMTTVLQSARNKFFNYFSWSLVHGVMTKTNYKCEETCSLLFWKNYCCASVKMAHTLKSGKLFNRQDIMCLKNSIADPNTAFKFDKVDFTVVCNGSSFIQITIWTSAVLGMIYYI